MTELIISEKACHRCKQIKPAEEFTSDKSRANGLSFYCASCSQEIDRARNPTEQRRIKRRAAFHRAKLKRPYKLAETKFCKYCEATKPADSFAYSPQMADGMKAKCKDCERPALTISARAYREQQRTKNPVEYRLKRRGEHCRRYGMSREEFWQMNMTQNGKCAICGSGPNMNRRFLDVDHDHATGKVRELLCTRCNTGIGRFKDDPDLCIKAAEYLRKHRQDVK